MNDRRNVRRRHRARPRGVAVCLVVVALVSSACGGNRSTAKPPSNNSGGTTSSGGTSSTLIDTSSCPNGANDTTGVSGNTVTFGTSLPLSGLYAPFSNILHGEQAYFNYINANGGVDV